jgi:hypothetical protein
MSEQPPTPDVPPTAPAEPTPTPAPTPPIPPAPTEGAANSEVLDAVKGLTEIVTKLVNKDAGIPPDDIPVKKPWTQWGSR